MTRRLALAGWCTGLFGAAVLLVAAGDGALSPPPLTDPASWAGWAAERSPVDAAFAVLRLVALATAGYLLFATALAVASSAGHLVAVADVLALPSLQRMVSAALGVGLVGATVAAGASSLATRPAVASSGAGDVMVQLPAASEPPTMHRVEEVPASAPPPTAAAPTWTVEPGDHLWSVAERVVGPDGDVAAYWRRLLEANPLPDPDLIFPGQTLVLPSLVP
jgi:nucleoid-associated protein YgaU